MTLDSPVSIIPLIGSSKAELLAKLGIQTVRDLLYYIPFRYNDFSQQRTIASIHPGETVTIVGTVETMKSFVTKNGKKIQQATVTDNTGSLTVIWFNQTYLSRIITPGQTISLSGKVDWFGRKLAMSVPQYEIITNDGDDIDQRVHTGRIVGVYSETEGITSKWLRSRIAYILHSQILTTLIVDILPASVQQQHSLYSMRDALFRAHFPETLAQAAEARRRLAFEEVFVLSLASIQLKKEWQQAHAALPISIADTTAAAFTKSLPFTLTPDQQQIIAEIRHDMQSSLPMNRLVLGDVGSGKTIIAASAAYFALSSGKSVALLAPTQILAEQHFQTISSLFDQRIPLVLHTSQTSKQNNKTISGQQPMWNTNTPTLHIGTHALLAQSRSVSNLGLIVIDEQHRFGVHQRSLLLSQHDGSHTPHLLTMTATPIPRTIAKTFFGHMTLSVITSPPQGRKPVKTWLIPPEKRDSAYSWIDKQINETGGQVFIICPLVSDSDDLVEVKAVTSEHKKITTRYPHYNIGLLHGRLKPKEKATVLTAFAQKKYQILCATPVVEVGIDIPNATIIVIEEADRFGLSQLHQLRGRVGRGDKPSYCLLFTQRSEPMALTRLKALEKIHNGPELAEVDLQLRGAGQVFGTKQHGSFDLKFASWSDIKLITTVQQTAETYLLHDATLDQSPYLSEVVKKSTIDMIITD